MRKFDLVATLALFGAILCWAVVPLFLKYLTGYIDAWTANGIRYPFSALLYVPWLIYFYRKGILTKFHWKLALLPSAVNIFGQVLWAWTPYFIEPGLMSFLVRLSTLWAVMGSFVLFSEERVLIHSRLFWSGFILTIGGFIVLSLGGRYSLEGARAVGIVIVFFCSIGWAGYQISVRRNMQNVDSRAAFGMIAFLTSLGLVFFMFTFGNPSQALDMPPLVVFVVLLSAFLGIAAAHLLFYVAIKRIGLAIASSANLVSAFISALLSRMFFNEFLTLVQWIAGVALVVGGVVLTRAQLDLHRPKSK